MTILDRRLTLADQRHGRFQLDPSGFLFIDLIDQELSAPFTSLATQPASPGLTELVCEGEAEPLWALTLKDEDADYLLRLIGRETLTGHPQ
ncbi:hypothetical protein SAMN02745129_3445 [Ferrimonas marina]|uniref:Uncharacterized protein n=2 Tax=Ferrimonas marina TaxID=299255 RepID=A0A1M5XDW5_9GAMM|nr:hypothetical protein SAMN02745129_3445 [Ferrimonas marina]